MALQNRVTPFGQLVADPARGTMMGVRGGMFHDPVERRLGRRRWASRRWICCDLAYRGRNAHPVWSRGYTQLFFLDEVTALAAGHRPCAECRRPAATAFRRTLPAAAAPNLEALDRQLHAERLDGRSQRRGAARGEELPDGAMVVWDGRAFALRGPEAFAWSSRGYDEAVPRPVGPIEVLTPPTSLAALRGGYAPLWHPTAEARLRKA